MTSAPKKYRSIFLSDFHLGSPHCRAEQLMAFLSRHDADTIYLVGDIFEAGNHSEWPAPHGDVIRELFRKMRLGTWIIYTPGNHDRIFHNYAGDYDHLTIAVDDAHTLVDGRVMLVTHGDALDRFKSWSLLSFLLVLENLLNNNLWETMRKYLGPMIRRHEKAFEKKMVAHARARGFDGVICGHVHTPKISRGAIYINTGDWVHHCSAVVEKFDGSLELVHV